MTTIKVIQDRKKVINNNRPADDKLSTEENSQDSPSKKQGQLILKNQINTIQLLLFREEIGIPGSTH